MIHLEETLNELRLPRKVSEKLLANLRGIQEADAEVMGNTVAQARDKAKDGQTYSSKRAKKVYKKGDEETTIGDKDKSKKPSKKKKKLSQDEKNKKNAFNHANKRLDEQEVRANDSQLTDEQVETLSYLNENLQKLNDPNVSDEEKRKIAKKLKDDFGLGINRPTTDDDGNPVKVKLYIKKFPGLEGQKLPESIRKALTTAGGYGNMNQTNLVNQINSHLPDDDKIAATSVGGMNERQLKNTLSAKAIPSFKNEDGSSTSVSSKNSPKLKSIFKPGTPLGDLKEIYHQIEAPTDDEGRLITADTPEGQKRHLRFLVENNQATKDTIAECRRLAKDEPSLGAIADALERHDKKMRDLLDGKVGIEVPSKEAEEYVKKAYAEMMADLYNANPDVAPAIAKQVSENALVSTELAAGEEVYMPTSGVFPGGDKIRVDRNGDGSVEGVAGVSVKFGRGSQGTEIYGFPANGSSIARFAEVPKIKNADGTEESDEDHEKRQNDVRTRNGEYVGQDGHSIGVRNDILEEEKQSEVIEQSGMGSAVKDKKEYNKITNEVADEVENFKKRRIAEYQKTLDNWKPPLSDVEKKKKMRTWVAKTLRVELQGHMKKVMSGNHTEPPTTPSLNDRFEKVIDREQLMIHLTGTKDGKYQDKDGNTRQHSNANLAKTMDAIETLNIISLASSIKEGQGMPSLAHNHQSHEDGKYDSTTVEPDETDMTDLANWGFQMRMYVTKGRAGGGAQLAGTGEASKYGIR